MKKNINELFDDKKMVLIASLPGNDVELARAAAAGGADMLKIHINVEHTASGTKFGSLSEELPRIEAILEAVDIPVGIMPGADRPADARELRDLAHMGISFFDIYSFHMPADYLAVEGIEAMVALGPDWRPFEPETLTALGVRLLEASIVPREQYGSPLVISDLLSYSYISKKFGGAVIVPTQKAIRPEETAFLRESGVRGLMIGKIVAGDDPATFEAAAARFAAAIGDL